MGVPWKVVLTDLRNRGLITDDTEPFVQHIFCKGGCFNEDDDDGSGLPRPERVIRFGAVGLVVPHTKGNFHEHPDTSSQCNASVLCLHCGFGWHQAGRMLGQVGGWDDTNDSTVKRQIPDPALTMRGERRRVMS